MAALFLYTDQMKRILFLIACLLPLSAKADMDKVCKVNGLNLDEIELYILENCERNNVLFWSENPYQVSTIKTWCRFDRNVERTKSQFTCILYSNKPRLSI